KRTGDPGPGGLNVSLFLARGPQPAAKGFNLGWIPVAEQVPPGTPVFAPNGTRVDVFGTRSPNAAPAPTNGFDGPDILCAPPICGPADAGAYYVAGFDPPAADPNDWFPAFRLAPLIIVRDPPASAAPTYYGETFSIPSGFADPNGLNDVYLADDVNGEDLLPSTLDTLGNGADDRFNFRG